MIARPVLGRPALNARLARVGVLVAAAFVYLWGIGSAGWTNPYYTLVVSSGLANGLGAVLAGEMDVFGFLAIDKPPLPQLLSWLTASLFGFEPWALLLPYALAGVASVHLLMQTVRRFASEPLAVLTGMIFLLIPATSASLRTNQVEAFDLLGRMLLVYGAVRAVEAVLNKRRSIGFWALSMLGVLISANSKMTMILPLVAVVIFASLTSSALPRAFKTRVAVAYLCVTALSLSAWALWFDLLSSTAAFSGSSPDGTALGNLIQQNLLLRLPFSEDPGYYFGNPGYQSTSLLRLFGAQYIDEWAWWAPSIGAGFLLLTATIFRLAGGSRRPRPAGRFIATGQFEHAQLFRFGAIVVLGWFVAYWVVLSFSASKNCCLHAYYIAPNAPVMAFLAAYALLASGRYVRVLLVGATVSWCVVEFTGGADEVISAQLDSLLSPGVITGILAGAALLLVAFSSLAKSSRSSTTAAIASVAVFASAVTAMGVVLPRPSAVDGDPASGRMLRSWAPESPLTLLYAPFPGSEDHAIGLSPYASEDVPNGLRSVLAERAPLWSAATLSSFSASAFALASGAAVMAYGGTKGYDEVITLEDFQRLVGDGDIRFGVVGRIDLCFTETTEKFSYAAGHEPAKIMFWLLRTGQPVPYETDPEAVASPTSTNTSVASQRWRPVLLRLDPAKAASDLADGNSWLVNKPAAAPFLSSC